jgi:hypothetical protein
MRNYSSGVEKGIHGSLKINKARKKRELILFKTRNAIFFIKPKFSGNNILLSYAKKA